LKSILTVATGAKVTELDSHDQTQQTLVENEGRKVDSDLLAQLKQEQKKATN